MYSFDDLSCVQTNEISSKLINHESAVFKMTKEKWNSLESKWYFDLKNKARSFSMPLKAHKNNKLNTLINDLYFRTLQFNINLLFHKGELDKLDINRTDKLIINEIINYALRGIFSYESVFAERLDGFLEYLDKTIEDKFLLKTEKVHESKFANKFSKGLVEQEVSTKFFFSLTQKRIRVEVLRLIQKSKEQKTCIKKALTNKESDDNQNNLVNINLSNKQGKNITLSYKKILEEKILYPNKAGVLNAHCQVKNKTVKSYDKDDLEYLQENCSNLNYFIDLIKLCSNQDTTLQKEFNEVIDDKLKKFYEYFKLLKKKQLIKGKLDKMDKNQKCRICLREFPVLQLKDHGVHCIEISKKKNEVSKLSLEIVKKIDELAEEKNNIVLESMKLRKKLMVLGGMSPSCSKFYT